MKQRVQVKRKATPMDKSQSSGAKKKKQTLSHNALPHKATSTSTPPLGVSNSGHLSHLKSLTAEQRNKYDQFASRGVILNRYTDKTALEIVDLLADVTEVLTDIGWEQLLTLNAPTYAELVYEFLSTFEFEELDTATREVEALDFRFRLMGKAYGLEQSDVQHIFGWVTIVQFGLPKFDEKAFWRSLTKNESEVYSGRCSKASKIVNPAYRYVYKLLAYSLFGRGSTGMVSKLELAVLYCVDNALSVDFVLVLGKHIKEVIAQKEGPIMIGWFVTMIDTHLQILDQCTPNLTMHPGKVLDLPNLVKMHFLRRRGKDYEIIPHEYEYGSTFLVPIVAATKAHEERHLSEAADESLINRVSGLKSKFQELKAYIGVVRADIANQQDLLTKMFDYMKFRFPQPPPR